MNINSITEEIIGIGKAGAALSRKERDKLLRKADIMQAAERVFALKGYHDAAMQDIAREAEYATGTVYLYFKDKESLYFSLLEEKMRNITIALKERTIGIPDAEEKFRIFVRESVNFFERNQDFFRIIFSERSKGQILKEGKMVKSSAMLQHKEFVEGLISVAQKQRVIRSDISPQQMGDIFGAIFMTFIFDWVKNGPKNTQSNDMADLIFDIFLSGAGRKK